MSTVDAWHPADGLVLEPNALRAAKEREHCLAVTAGPGAGKTETLAQKADFLLRSGSCRYPKRILAISFKVDASRNLKERVMRRCGFDLASRFDSHTFHAFAKRIIDRFRPALTGDSALNAGYQVTDRKNGPSTTQVEFADLVPLAIEILQRSRVARNAVRQTYAHVFLDEFQDCTNLQYDLVRIAFQGTGILVTAVGDTKQKIMGWAGALDGVFQTFATDFGAKPLNLYRNFRSAPRLLRMQNEIIRVLDPASVMPADQLAGEEGEVLTHHFANSREEAEHLCNLVDGWMAREQLPCTEIAVLVSRQLDLYANHLMTALALRGIPFRNEQQLQDLTTEPVARLIVDYLSCLYGYHEPKAWVRLVKQLVPFSDMEAQIGARRDVDNLIKGQRKKVAGSKSYSDWWDCAQAFLNQVGIETLVALSPEYESHRRLRDVIENTKLRIHELLDLEPNLPKALQRFSDDQAVRILTIHKSKGLEFDSVIIMAVENETFFGNQDENRCAFFVGASRAKRRLILTSADLRERPDGHTGRWSTHRSRQTEYLGYVNETDH